MCVMSVPCLFARRGDADDKMAIIKVIYMMTVQYVDESQIIYL